MTNALEGLKLIITFFIVIFLLTLGVPVLIAVYFSIYEPVSSYTKPETANAYIMHEIAASALVTELSEKEFAEGKSLNGRDSYWREYAEYLPEPYQEDALVIAGILCDIERYASYGRYEFKLINGSVLSENQRKFFLRKNYNIDEEGTVIYW